MKYLVLTYHDEKVWERADHAERDRVMGAHMAFDQVVRTQARMLAGEALATVDSATSLRHERDRIVLTDAPLAGTANQQLAGFYLIDAPDLDVMTGLCEKLLVAYTIEIRPVVDTG